MNTTLWLLLTTLLLNATLIAALLRNQKPQTKHIITGSLVGLFLSVGAMWFMQINPYIAFPLMGFFLSSPLALPGFASLFNLGHNVVNASQDLIIQTSIVLSNAGTWTLAWAFIAEQKWKGLGMLIGGIGVLIVIGIGLIMPIL